VDDLLVAIPWRETDPHRVAALQWVARQWESVGHTGIMLGASGIEDWCKALAVENAIRDQPGDILVVSDADAWSPGVVEAIQHVRDGAAWAVPHYKVYRLNQDATAEVLAGREPHEDMPLDPFRPDLPGFAYAGVLGGGIVVLRREVYEDCPLDPRFRGWGQEDESLGLALTCLHGPPVRLDHPLWHLWHPPQQRKTRGVGSDEGMALYKRYSRAKRRPEQMRALIEEGRHAHCL
jgi:hypothetical protein